MSQADDIDPNRSLQEWMAWELRTRRKSIGLTQKSLAGCANLAESLVQHLEAGRRPFRKYHAERLDVVLATDGVFVRLWTHAQREHIRDWFRTYAAFERRAREIRIWQPLVIPGLFQTPEYARALIESAYLPEVESLVETRMSRQELLRQPEPPLVTALFDERALRQPVPGVKAMCEQLDHLAEAASLPHVTLQVVPARARAHIGLDGGFILLDLGGEDGRLAFVEAQRTGRLVRDEDEVRTLAVRYDRIRAKALSEDDSLELIKDITKGMR